MPDVKISELTPRQVQQTDLIPAIDAGGQATYKVEAGDIAALGGGPPAAHTHGNVTNDGKIGTAANTPIITGTGGVLQAGSFGTAANTFCQGNDSRLSNARTPSAHASTHQTGGSDAVPLVIPNSVSLTASVNDWAPNGGDGDIIKFSCSTNLNITGVHATTMKAKALMLVNVGASNSGTLINQSNGAAATSAAANRIITPDGFDYEIKPGFSATIWYDPQASRWRLIG